jgi:hypothetical protein
MRTICAWCLTVIKTGDDGPDARISHGICRRCENAINVDLALVDAVNAANRKEVN